MLYNSNGIFKIYYSTLQRIVYKTNNIEITSCFFFFVNTIEIFVFKKIIMISKLQTNRNPEYLELLPCSEDYVICMMLQLQRDLRKCSTIVDVLPVIV